mmetsp:Transcript_10170/g.12653  ORF Transcript_10170/g.12653 Transcript_10170/m.12653 type:complete len:496 (+) Transcript_10170:42-1529(+)
MKTYQTKNRHTSIYNEPSMEILTPNDNMDYKDNESNVDSTNESKRNGLYLNEIVMMICQKMPSIRDGNDLIDAVLLTYPSVTTNIELLKALKLRFFGEMNTTSVDISNNKRRDSITLSMDDIIAKDDEKKNDAFNDSIIEQDYHTQTKVISVLKQWMSKYWIEDFNDNNALIDELKKFADKIINKCNECSDNASENEIRKRLKLANMIINSIKAQKKKYLYDMYNTYDEMFFNGPSNRKMYQNKSIFEYENLNIAQELTLMDFKLFKKIRKRECMDENWKKKKNNENELLAPNILNVIKHFNDVDKWVKWAILQEKNDRKRGRIIKKFIKIMHILLYDLRNFQGVFNVFSALNSNPIFRLKESWKYIPKKHLVTFNKVKSLLDSTNSFSKLRELQRNAINPQIPYCGIFVSDLVKMNQMGKLKTGDSINIKNITKTLEIINKQLIFQNTPYNTFKEDILVKQFLINELDLASKIKKDYFYRCSLNIEPKNKKKKH